MPDAGARMAVLLSAYCGVHAGELWALGPADVNPLRQELIVSKALKEVTIAATERLPDGYTRLTPSLVLGPTKTYAVRKLSLPRFLARELAKFDGLGRASAFIFTDSDGGPVRTATLQAHLPAERAGRLEGHALA